MNINLDKFWEWLQQWSVGKIIVTLSLLVIIFKDFLFNPKVLSYFIALGVFLQLFDFCDNSLTNSCKKDIGNIQKIGLNIYMLIAIISMIVITYNLLRL